MQKTDKEKDQKSDQTAAAVCKTGFEICESVSGEAVLWSWASENETEPDDEKLYRIVHHSDECGAAEQGFFASIFKTDHLENEAVHIGAVR